MIKETEKRAKMMRLVSAWRGSGMSKSTFCDSHGLNKHTFDYWVDKLKDEVVGSVVPSPPRAKSDKLAKAGFIRLESISEPVQVLEICFPKGARLLLSGSLGSSEVQLLHTLLY